MKRIVFFLIPFIFNSHLFAVEGASVSRPIVREFDSLPSSRPAIIEFPNGSLTINNSTASIHLPTFQDVSNATTSSIQSWELAQSSIGTNFESLALSTPTFTTYAVVGSTYNDLREKMSYATNTVLTSVILPLPEKATNYLQNFSTGMFYNIPYSTITISSITANYVSILTSTDIVGSPKIFSISSATADIFYVKQATNPNYSPNILLNGFASVFSTINYGHPLQLGLGETKTSYSYPNEILAFCNGSRGGNSAITLRGYGTNEFYIRSDGSLGTATNQGMSFRPNQVEKMIFDTSGELSLTDTTNGKIVIGATAGSNDPAFWVLTGSASINNATKGALQVKTTDFIVSGNRGQSGVRIGTTTQKGALTILGTNVNDSTLWVGSTNSQTSLFQVGHTSATFNANLFVTSVTFSNSTYPVTARGYQWIGSSIVTTVNQGTMTVSFTPSWFGLNLKITYFSSGTNVASVPQFQFNADNTNGNYKTRRSFDFTTLTSSSSNGFSPIATSTVGAVALNAYIRGNDSLRQKKGMFDSVVGGDDTNMPMQYEGAFVWNSNAQINSISVRNVPACNYNLGSYLMIEGLSP